MISLPAHAQAAASCDSVNCADGADLSAALAYIATAEGSAATMAERACDRAGLDYAACPADILDAAERRAESLELAAIEAELAAAVKADAALQTEHGRAMRAVDSAECARLIALRKPIQADIQRLAATRLAILDKREGFRR